jgi:putative peptidoglycan lipid II flippase
MKKRLTTTIAGASALLTIFGFLGKILGLARESIFANYFGLSSDFDLYLVAVVIPLGVNSVILYVTQNYFIPNYHTIKSKSVTDAKSYSNTTFWVFSISGFLLAFILFLLSEPILKLYLQIDDTAMMNLALVIFQIFIFTIPLNTIYSIFASLLQAELRFKHPILSQLMVNSIVIIFVLLFNDQLKIISIPIGYLTGTFLQVLYLYSKVRDFFIPDIRKFFSSSKFAFLGSSFIFLIFIEILGQSYSIIDRYFINHIDVGGIAALNYAFILFNLPITIIAFALATILFSTLSKLYAENSLNEISNHLNNFFSINLFIFIPISIIFIFFGNSLITIIFERGAFGERATSLTANVLVLYAISYVFLSSYFVLNKLFYSFNKIRVLFFITITGILIKVFLSSYLVSIYKQDGLALSTSLTYVFLFSVSYFLIFKRLDFKNFRVFFIELIFSGINGFFAYILVRSIGINLLLNSDILADLFNIVLFITLYFLNALLVKHRAVNLIFDLINNFLGTKLKVA